MCIGNLLVSKSQAMGPEELPTHVIPLLGHKEVGYLLPLCNALELSIVPLLVFQNLLVMENPPNYPSIQC